MGGVQDILLAMRSFPNDIEIVSNACRSIWALSLNGMYLHTSVFVRNLEMFVHNYYLKREVTMKDRLL